MKIECNIPINSTPEEIFPWIDDPNKAIFWQKDVKNYKILKSTPEKIGTLFIEEMEENGKSLVIKGEITHYNKNKLISFHLESTIHKLNIDYSFEKSDNQTIVRIYSYIIWRFPIKILLLVIGRKLKNNILQQTKEELKVLKSLCEDN